MNKDKNASNIIISDTKIQFYHILKDLANFVLKECVFDISGIKIILSLIISLCGSGISIKTQTCSLSRQITRN